MNFIRRIGLSLFCGALIAALPAGAAPTGDDAAPGTATPAVAAPVATTPAAPTSELSVAKSAKTSVKSVASRMVAAPKPGKIDKIIAMMRRPKGASINDLTKATAWQAHSVRGAISGTLRKKQGLNVVSEKSGDVRLYRITDKAVG